MLVLSDVLTNEHSHAAMTTAISSSLGRECCLSGAALDFDIISVQLVPCCRYTTVPYARRLESAKMCKVDSDIDGQVVHCLGNGNAVACTISREIWF